MCIFVVVSLGLSERRDSVASVGSSFGDFADTDIGSTLSPPAASVDTKRGAKSLVSVTPPPTVDAALLVYLSSVGHAAPIWALLQRPSEALRLIGLRILSRWVDILPMRWEGTT